MVRVRFAPSPTGSLHIGGVRTALYNYLFAKKHKGTFILRIEDTDLNRFVPGAEAYINDSLKWLGILPDESVEMGGDFGPYRQSERSDIYRKYAFELVEKGLAYYAFDTPSELDVAREKSMQAGNSTFQYNSATRHALRNSITLPKEQVQELIDSGAPYVIRLKVPKKDEIRLNDLIRGWVMVHSSTLDDKVLLKSDGMPTYHLANVVDDYLMKITHVIRGEEWLPSAPFHVLLYQCLGWEKEMPQFAHLPLILKPVGDGKLSKRDGEELGFPVFPLAWTDPNSGKTISGFREEGYLPEALLNFLAFQGWNPGTEQEIFSLEELVEAFSLERIGKAGTRFDINKAKWYNHTYLQKVPEEYFFPKIKDLLFDFDLHADPSSLSQWVSLVRNRCSFEKEMLAEIASVAQRPETFEKDLWQPKWNDDAQKGFAALLEWIFTHSFESPLTVKEGFQAALEAIGLKPGKVLQLIRIALTGKAAGPDLMTILYLLGKEECMARLSHAVAQFKATN